MLTTAILGLLNANQIAYATRMSRLVTFEDKRALLDGNSDLSSSDFNSDPSEHNSDPFAKKKSHKRKYYNNLATGLIKSNNKIDRRFMKLHEMHAYPNRKTSLLDNLGFLAYLKYMFPGRSESQSDNDSSSQND